MNRVLDVEPRAAFDQQTNYGVVACQNGLMQRGRMSVVSFRVVAIRILAGVEEQADDIHVTMLRRQRERAMAGFSVGGWQQPARFRESA